MFWGTKKKWDKKFKFIFLSSPGIVVERVKGRGKAMKHVKNMLQHDDLCKLDSHDEGSTGIVQRIWNFAE